MTFRRWRDETPPQFRFALKAHRYLTHNKKLKDPLAPIRLERNRASALGPKLAAVLWQLPHNFHRNLERLERFARALGVWRKRAMRSSSPSFVVRRRGGRLRAQALSAVPVGRRRLAMGRGDTDLVYVRLHGHEQTYASDYSESALRTRKVRRWTREGRDVHVYFDNDAYGYAPRNAVRLAALVSRGR